MYSTPYGMILVNSYKINFDGAIFEKDNCAGLEVIIRNLVGLVMASLHNVLIPLHFSSLRSKPWQQGKHLNLFFFG